MTTVEHLTVKEAAALLRVSDMHVHNLISRGELPAFDTGKGSRHFWRIPRTGFDKYVESLLAESARRFRAS